MTTTDNIHILRPLADDDARRLLERFDSGLTSVDEERDLYAYFRRKTLPPDLEPLRGLMAWYEGGCIGEPAQPAPVAKPSHRRKRRFGLLGAAASAALLIGIGITAITLGHEDSDDSFATLYAGSYVIRDGKKITDPDLIRDEILRTEALADSLASIGSRYDDPDRLIANAVRSAYADNPYTAQLIIDMIENN